MKVERPLQYRALGGPGSAPIEQYWFQVDGQVGERFADAAALVMAKHGVEIDPAIPADQLQIYVRRATAILKGQEKIRLPLEHQQPELGLAA
jgi:hypothetical protein